MLDEVLREGVIAIARDAGGAIMAVHEGDDFAVRAKADASPVTAADLAAHRCIVDGLARLTPEIPVLSEESAHTVALEQRRGWTRFWLVDPLDGTREFLKRNGEFTVNIALIEDGVPVFGVIQSPVSGAVWHGAPGQGAFHRDGDGERRLGQVLLGHQGTLLRHQAAQQFQFPAGQLHGLLIGRDQARTGAVKPPSRRKRWPGQLRHPAAQLRPDPCHQLFHVHRLHEVLERTRVQAEDAALHFGPCRHEYGGYPHFGESAHKAQTVFARQPYVDDNQIRTFAQQLNVEVLCRLRRPGAEPCLFQISTHVVADVFVVFHDGYLEFRQHSRDQT